jgi:uncharacterized protein (DUF1800 family)
MGGPRRRIARPNDFKDQGATARLLRQMYLGPTWSEITNITNTNNVIGLASTLVQGNKTITLTSGSTANLFVGQTLQANTVGGSNAGVFGNTNPTIIDIELGSTTNCTIDFAHSTGGTISFDALSVVNTGLDRFIEKQMDILIPVRTAEQGCMVRNVGGFNQYASFANLGPDTSYAWLTSYQNRVENYGSKYPYGAGHPYFVVSNDGTMTHPEKMILTAKALNLTTFNPVFAVTNGTVTGGLTPTANANSVVLSASSMSTNSVTIMCTQDGLSCNVTIIKVWPSTTSKVFSATPWSDDYYVQANTTSNSLQYIITTLDCFLNNTQKNLYNQYAFYSSFVGIKFANNTSNITAKFLPGSSGIGGGYSTTEGQLFTLSNMIANVATLTITANCGTYSNPTLYGTTTRTITFKKSFAEGSNHWNTAKSLSIEREWRETKTMEENVWNLQQNAGAVGRLLPSSEFRTGTSDNSAARYFLHPDKFRIKMARVFDEFFSLGFVETIDTNYHLYPMQIFSKNAFGNFKTLLMDVTRTWEMSYFLTYNANEKATGASLPDENYARELMQLFTIGLWELKLDGTRKKAFELDTNDSRYIPQGTNGWDQEVPTYIYSADVANLARVFTGLRSVAGPTFELGGEGKYFGNWLDDTVSTTSNTAYRPLTGEKYGLNNPIIIDSRKHEYELPKVTMAWKYTGDANTVTGNTVEQDLAFSYQQANNGMIIIPRRSFDVANTLTNTEKENNSIAGSTSERDLPTSVAMREVDIVLTALVNHPSCAPFVSKRLIRMIVTSNPSPAYVARVASVFKNDGTGQVGNLRAVFKAIIMDQEARAPASKGLISKATGIWDHFAVTTIAGPRYKDKLGGPLGFLSGTYTLGGDPSNYIDLELTGVSPGRQLSIFGTYPPEYSPVGPVAQDNLISPESFAYTDNNCIELYNDFKQNNAYLNTNYSNWYSEHTLMTSNTSIQTSAQANTNIRSLISKYNILFTGNTMPESYTSNVFSMVYGFYRGGAEYNTQWAYRLLLQAIHTSPYSTIRT